MDRFVNSSTWRKLWVRFSQKLIYFLKDVYANNNLPRGNCKDATVICSCIFMIFRLKIAGTNIFELFSCILLSSNRWCLYRTKELLRLLQYCKVYFFVVSLCVHWIIFSLSDNLVNCAMKIYLFRSTYKYINGAQPFW